MANFTDHIPLVDGYVAQWPVIEPLIDRQMLFGVAKHVEDDVVKTALDASFSCLLESLHLVLIFIDRPSLGKVDLKLVCWHVETFSHPQFTFAITLLLYLRLTEAQVAILLIVAEHCLLEKIASDLLDLLQLFDNLGAKFPRRD